MSVLLSVVLRLIMLSAILLSVITPSAVNISVIILIVVALCFVLQIIIHLQSCHNHTPRGQCYRAFYGCIIKDVLTQQDLVPKGCISSN